MTPLEALVDALLVAWLITTNMRIDRLKKQMDCCVSDQRTP